MLLVGTVLGTALGTKLGTALGSLLGTTLGTKLGWVDGLQFDIAHGQNSWDGGYMYLVLQSPANPDSDVGYVQ